MSKFIEKLGSEDWLLADGATGTNLFDMGLMSGDAPELWNIKHPTLIYNLYRDAVDAGSDIFLTNRFCVNALRLKLHNLGTKAFELSKISAEIARNVADSVNVLFLLLVRLADWRNYGTNWRSFTQNCSRSFLEQAQGLKDGGADVLWLETISAPEELVAAAEAFSHLDLPWMGTMSFDTAGHTMMGTSPSLMVNLISSISNKPIAFGANCGTGASDLLRTIQDFSKSASGKNLIAKGNAGIPKYVDGHIHYDGTPDLMAKYAVMARDSGLKLLVAAVVLLDI